MLRALAVDDNYPVVRMYQRFLSRSIDGMVVDGADDGPSAVALLREHDYDLVITDTIMPNTNLHYLLDCILSHPSRPGVLVTQTVDWDFNLPEAPHLEGVMGPVQLEELRELALAVMSRRPAERGSIHD